MLCCCWVECSLYIYWVHSIWSTVMFQASVFYLLSRYSIHNWKWVIELYYYCFVISPFNSIHVCFIYLCALMLGAYIFIIVMSSWWTDPFLLHNVLCLLWQFLTSDFFCLIEVLPLSYLGYHSHGISFSILFLLACVSL